MLAYVLAATLTMLQGTPVDTASTYGAVLNDIRTSHPGLPVVLAESRSAVQCMPHCEARLRQPDGGAASNPSSVPLSNHSQSLIRTLREMGLVQEWCKVPDGAFGCDGHPDHLFVGLGEISEAPAGGPPKVEGALWVKAALLVPGASSCEADDRTCRHPDGYGIWYLVGPEKDGTVKVLQRLPAFFL